RYESLLTDPQCSALFVDETGGAGEDAGAHVEDAFLVVEGETAGGPPVPVVEPQVQEAPVGQVDHRFVFEGAALHRAGEPVDDPGHVRTGGGAGAGGGLGRGSADGQVAVRHCREGGALAFVGVVRADVPE